MDCHWFFDKTQKKLRRRETGSEEKEVEEKNGNKERPKRKKVEKEGELE